MADVKKIGQGSARLSTINELKRRQAEIEEEKRKNMLREQIIFVFIAILSVSPLVAAFMVEDKNTAYFLFKVGGATLILLYPSYLILRTVVGALLKGGQKKAA